jgi:CRISPR system Cascade subunit CasA
MSFSEDGIVEWSVDVVLFRPAKDGWVTPVGAGKPVLLSEPEPPDSDSLAALLDATVRLTVPSDIPDEVVQAIAEMPTPALFRCSPWLHEHKALVFRDGRCAIGGHVLRYRDTLGVSVEDPPVEPAPEGSASFDLLTQPWIPAVGLDGKVMLVGLEDLILHAHNLRRIAAEAPTMTAALYRLVLAFLHRVYGPESEQAWGALWSAGQLPPDPVRRYVGLYRDCFDLFHPQRPFMQCVGLAAVAPSTPAKLVPYRAVGNNVTLFDHTTSADRVVLSQPEAARWLVTSQAFDPGGMKTPYQKDKSSERAPCNLLGVVLVEGGNLKETLLLNALVYLPDYEKPTMTTPGDRPVWEDRDGPSPVPGKRSAHGWTDLLTWPSRRILVSPGRKDGTTVVDGVVITPGTRLVASLPDEEVMAAFRRPRDTKGRPKRDAPMLPVRLRPGRGIWRHSVELLMTSLREEQKSRQRPRALDQIAELAEHGHFPGNTVYTLRVFGQQLDAKASVVEAWLEDTVPAPVALLRARDESLGALIGCAITLADEAGSALRALQADYRRELRAEPASDIDLSYWPRLSAPFGTFLVSLGHARVDGRSERPAAEEWARKATSIARSVADRWVAGSPTEARQMVLLGKHHGRFLIRLAAAERGFQAEIDIYATGQEDAG